MLKLHTQRPAALQAVCAQSLTRSWQDVSELLSFATAPVTRVRAGYGAAAAAAVTDITTPVQQRSHGMGANKISPTAVLVAKSSVIDMDPVGGLRGKPPRRRPV